MHRPPDGLDPGQIIENCRQPSGLCMAPGTQCTRKPEPYRIAVHWELTVVKPQAEGEVPAIKLTVPLLWQFRWDEHTREMIPDVYPHSQEVSPSAVLKGCGHCKDEIIITATARGGFLTPANGVHTTEHMQLGGTAEKTNRAQRTMHATHHTCTGRAGNRLCVSGWQERNSQTPPLWSGGFHLGGRGCPGQHSRAMARCTGPGQLCPCVGWDPHGRFPWWEILNRDDLPVRPPTTLGRAETESKRATVPKCRGNKRCSGRAGK